ncbi:MAG: carboxypeptidase regulatory-like domain-containing protein [bacterium]|nr:carboxypeptidase regulatory-like domain-containing protein [bacterium]
MFIKRLFSSSAILLLAVVLVASVLGQGTTSRITGTVTDNNGAAVPGALVTLSNPSTNSSLTATTSDNGVYLFDLINPGTYTVTIEKEGFKKVISSNVVALINQPSTVNVALEIGDVSAVVNVESAAETVQTSTSGNVGSTIDQQTLQSLPIVGLRGRNPLDLLNFQPGVVVGSNTGGGVHVNGSRDRAFNFTLDGIDINDTTAGGSNFTPLRPNPDSIQEFQIVTTNATAELGRNSGAQVTLVTKSGTNRYRGNIFEYYQTPGVNANQFESNLNKVGRPQFVQHIYGFSLGGPIPTFGLGEGGKFRTLKDKAFFFVNYQRLFATETRLTTRTVYTEQARAGNFRYLVGAPNSISAVNADGSPRFPNCSASVTTQCIRTYSVAANSPVSYDPFVSGILNDYPLPNSFAAGDGLNLARYVFNAPQNEKQWDLVMRFDYNLNDKNKFYLRYAEGAQITVADSVNGGLQPFPGYPNLVDTTRRPKNYAFNHRWSPTAKFTNEAIFGISRFRFTFFNPEVRPDVPFILNSVADAFGNQLGNARAARTFQFVDNMTFDFSPHILKAGVNVRLGRVLDDRSGAGGAIEGSVGFGAGSSEFVAAPWNFNLPTTAANGIAAGDITTLRSLVNNLIGRIGSYTQGFVVSPGNPNSFAPAGTRWNFRAYYPEYDFYFQDTWRMFPNFIVDLGLRYEIKPSPTSNELPILAPDRLFTAGATPTNAITWEEKPMFANDTDNWGPSVGFAWDPFSDGKTSIRANYRLSYDRFATQVFTNSIWQGTPGNVFSGSATGIAQQNLLFRNGLPNLTPTRTPAQLRTPDAFSTASITLVDPDVKYPEVHSWFAGFQRDVFWDSVLEVNYIGKRGTHLFGGYDANQVDIFAKDPRCSKNFLETFIAIKGGSTNECLTNLMFTGNPSLQSGTTTFRGIAAISTTLSAPPTSDPSLNVGGSVATAARVVSQQTCSASNVTAGLCTSTSQQLISRSISNPYFFQRFPQFLGAMNVLDSNDYSRYNGIEVDLKRRLTGGLGYTIGYVWSVSKDTRSYDPVFTTVSRDNNQSASSTPFDLRDRNLNYSWSDFDRRHVLNATYVYELPFGKGRKWASDAPTALDWAIGGWQVAGRYNWSSGRPFTVYSGLYTVGNVTQATANCNDCPRNLGSLVERNGTNYWFSEEAEARFTQPAPGELGNTPRNYFIGPRRFQTDISISKKFRFTETLNFDLRVDAQNLTNTASFGLPTATANNSVFGQIRDNVASSARRIQFSGKLNF